MHLVFLRPPHAVEPGHERPRPRLAVAVYMPPGPPPWEGPPARPGPVGARRRTRLRAASPAGSGPKPAVHRSAAKYLAQFFASRPSVWIRSPGRRGLDPGAITAPSTFQAGNEESRI